LHLTNNDFSGTLPNDLGMNSLIEFMVSQNSFSGTLPTELGSLMKMTNLELSSNNFSGTIPKEVSESASLLRIGKLISFS
jgi:Leucine-rich repeat (LRR) protein